MKETAQRRELVAWVAREIMPHEPSVRAWLAQRVTSPADTDELIQEAYCKISELQSIDHIDRPDGYFFQVVRNLLRSQMRRARVVRFELIAEIEERAGSDPAPSPERQANDSREMQRIYRLIEQLPERCRQIFTLRKLEGLPQREIAMRMNVTETIVENEGARGLRLILEGLREQGEALAADYESRRGRNRKSGSPL